MCCIILEELKQPPLEKQRIELVERKGTGHPDSICDAIMERVSVALCREYLNTFGHILHHNIDKGLLVAGRTEPRLGGGTVLEPMRLIFGDRALSEYKGKRIDVDAIAKDSARDWIRRYLRFVDPDRHVVFQNELKQGSPELTDIFERKKISANDTSAAVGYAPLTETERMVLVTERFLNSVRFKEIFPDAGEDVKVMAYRHDRDVTLTVALAFVDRFVPNAKRYFLRKKEMQESLEEYLSRQQHTLDRITVNINTLDDPNRGESGMYLTVLGTSAEGGDCGQVGRGNKVNGLIAFNRPMSTEAAAGKNPISHAGKIYTLLTHRIAEEIYAKVPGLEEVYVWLGSQIGRPIDQPFIASVQVGVRESLAFKDIKPSVKKIFEYELQNIDDFTARLSSGELPVW